MTRVALLEKAAFDHGLLTWVHRVTQFVGEGASSLDIMAMVFEYTRKLGIVPKVDTAIGARPIDLVRVEDVAEDHVRETVASVCLGQTDEQPRAPHFVHPGSHAKFPPRYLEIQ